MNRRAAIWVAMVFAWSWGLAAVFAVLGLRAEGYLGVAMAVPYLTGPLWVSLAWKRWVAHEPLGGLDTDIHFGPWLVTAWIAPVVVTWAAALVAHAFGWGQFDLTGSAILERVAALRGAEAAAEMKQQLDALFVPYPVMVTFQSLVIGVLVYTPLAFTSEIGWRGVLLRELRPLGTWTAGLLIGTLWGLWQVPLVLLGHYFPGEPGLGAVALVGTCIPMGAVLCWLREKAGTVWAPATAWGVLTAMGNFHELVLRGGDPRATSVLGLAGGVVMLGLAVGLFAADRRRR